MKFFFKNLIFSVSLFLSLKGISSATTPGKKIKPIEFKIVKDAELFTTGLYLSGNQEFSVRLVYLPEELLPMCLSQSYERCWDLRKKLKPDSNRIPTTPLTLWLYSTSSANKIALEKMKECREYSHLSKENPEVDVKINRACSLKGTIKWTLWPNGENFELVEVKK